MGSRYRIPRGFRAIRPFIANQWDGDESMYTPSLPDAMIEGPNSCIYMIYPEITPFYMYFSTRSPF